MTTKELERIVSELQAEKLQQEAVERYKRERRQVLWEFVKSVLVPLVVSVVTVLVTK